MEETIFTKIIKGDIPSHKIYEDENTFAFLDIYPALPGHTLVIHKTAEQFVWDLDDTSYQELMASAKKIANHYRQVFDKNYISLNIVGTDVPHNHVHLLPFNDSSELHISDRDRMAIEPDHAELAKLAEKLCLKND